MVDLIKTGILIYDTRGIIYAPSQESVQKQIISMAYASRGPYLCS